MAIFGLKSTDVAESWRFVLLSPNQKADGEGFEPTVPRGYSGFQDRCIKPLCHPSFVKIKELPSIPIVGLIRTFCLFAMRSLAIQEIHVQNQEKTDEKAAEPVYGRSRRLCQFQDRPYKLKDPGFS